MLNRRIFSALLIAAAGLGFTTPARATEEDNWQQICQSIKAASHLGKNFRNALLEELAAQSPSARTARLHLLGL